MESVRSKLLLSSEAVERQHESFNTETIDLVVVKNVLLGFVVPSIHAMFYVSECFSSCVCQFLTL